MSVTTGKDAVLDWKLTQGRADATLDGGKTATIALHHAAGMTAHPVVIKNLKYEGASRNDGFLLMPNELERIEWERRRSNSMLRMGS